MQINIEKNQKEIKAHGDYRFPVHISEESITRYEGSAFLWHWHPEIELTFIQRGQMEYHVNEKSYLLKEGEGLFGNSNALHSGYMKDNQNCEYISITFHPRFIYGYESSLLQTKYVDFILTNADWACLKLEASADWQREVLTQMQHIYSLSKNPPPDYELAVHLSLGYIWKQLYHYYASLPEKKQQTGEHLERLKLILSFIQERYNDAVTLEDISASVNICKSECCRFFKRHMNMTLFEYLMFYRIQRSLPMLRAGDSITKAAVSVGFSDSSYYGKIFKRYMGCSPSAWTAQCSPSTPTVKTRNHCAKISL